MYIDDIKEICFLIASQIYDGPTINNYQLLAASGPIIPSSVISSGSQVLITFFSDGSVNDKGFNASYSVRFNACTFEHYLYVY